MKRNIILLLFFFVFLMSTHVFAQNPDFKLEAEILMDETVHPYKSVRLVHEIYNHSTKNLGDLRIMDDTGETVPYFINRYRSEQKTIYKVFSAPKINAYVKGDDYYYDFRITPTEENADIHTDTDMITNTIRFNLAENKDHFTQVEIFGSYDNIAWQPVVSDSIFTIQDISKQNVHLPSPVKFTFFRIKILNTLNKINISDLIVQFDEKTYNEIYYTNTMDVPFTVFENEEEHTTEISLQPESLLNLKIQSITLVTDDMFKRNVSYGSFQDTLYNLDFESNKLANTSIKLLGQFFEKENKILIYNHDDKPLTVQSIQVQYYVDDVVFKSKEGQKYYIVVGNDSLDTPVYDIESYKDNILQEGFDSATLAPVSITGTNEESAPEMNFFEKHQQILLNATVTIAGIILTAIVLLSLRKSAKK